MGNKPLITENKLSWIRDTTDEAPDPVSRPDDAPKQREAKVSKEHASRQVSEPRYAPDAYSRTDAAQGARRTPDYSQRTETATQRRMAERDAFQEPPVRQETRHAPQYGGRQEMYYAEGSQPREQAAYGRPRRPGMAHYWLALLALICVAVTVPERYSVLIFLGFIFVILLEISYRVGQHYYQDRVNSETIQKILLSLKHDDRGDRMGQR